MKKKYSVAEIDTLRGACSTLYLFGTLVQTAQGGMSRSYQEADKAVAVEAMCRTYMTAGITAEDLYGEKK